MKKIEYGILQRTRAAFVLVTAATIAAAAVGITSLAAAQTPPPAPKPPPATAPGADPGPAPTPDQISYAIGLNFGAQMRTTGMSPTDIAPNAVLRGITEGLQAKKPTQADMMQIQTFARSVSDAAAARNLAAAKDYLARNAHAPGVVTTASGLQYKILASGDKKASPITPTDTVTADYRGKLIDGTEFDSSYSRGVPTPFPVNGVIKGWQEALVMMKPGAKWQLFIPPDLAYGPRPQAMIPANSLLIFEVNVISVEPANAPPKAPPGTPPSPPRTNR